MLHLWLVRPPTLIPEPYALLLPPSHGLWEALPPLLCHHNVKNRLCGNIMGHTFVTLGGILPNHPYTLICQILTNGGSNPNVRFGTEAYGQKSSTSHDYVGFPTPAGFGVLRPTTPIWIVGQAGPLPRRS